MLLNMQHQDSIYARPQVTFVYCTFCKCLAPSLKLEWRKNSYYPYPYFLFNLVLMVSSLPGNETNSSPSFLSTCSINQYYNMAPRLLGQTCIFGDVFFVFKSLLGIERQKKLKKIYNFEPKASEPC